MTTTLDGAREPAPDAAVVLREDFKPDVEAGRRTMERTVRLLATMRALRERKDDGSLEEETRL